MYQHVGRPKPPGSFFYRSGGILRPGHVGQDQGRAPAELRHPGRNLPGFVIVIAADQGHVRSTLGQNQGRCRADPAGAARDQRHFTFQFHSMLLLGYCQTL